MKRSLFAVALILWSHSSLAASGPDGLCHVLSPEWLVLALDYNDQNDAAFYAHDQARFDQWNVELEKLERGEIPDWTKIKARRELWARDYALMATQHLALASCSYFTISSPEDAAYAAGRHPERAISWVQSLGDRQTTPGAPLRACSDYQIGHYAFIHLAPAMKEGATYRISLADGRAYQVPFTPTLTVISSLKCNQIGYRPDARGKFAYLGAWVPVAGAVDFAAFKRFELRRDPGDEVVFKGDITLRAPVDISFGTNTLSKGIPYSGETTYQLDFSAVTNAGSFHLYVPGLGRSRSFLITPVAYGEAFYVQARGFYQQRCGTALQEPFTFWTRLPCHTNRIFQCGLIGNGGNDWRQANGKVFKEIKNLDFEVIKATARTNVSFAVSGGWHDAADYDRRESHHIAVWDLLGAYELNKAAFTDGQLNIPESGNGIPDILDEAAWGVEVWTRAQEADGGVCGRIETLSHPHHRGMPDRDTDPWFKSIPNRESTLSYAASAAWLASLLKPFDPARAAELLAHAERAYHWACRGTNFITQAEVTLPLGPGEGKEKGPLTLHWKEDPRDRIFPGMLAAEALYAATTNATYLDDVRTFGPDVVRYFKVYPNYLCHSWPMFRLASAAPGLYPSNLCAEARSELIRFANEREVFLDITPYRHPWNPAKSRRWGGALPATNARYFLLAWKLTGDTRYKSDALLSADFHLGCNPLGLVQTTGLGAVFPCVVQDAETRADGLFEPVPGLTPYGIISIPHGVMMQVYHMTLASEAKGGPSTQVSFLPPPYDGERPPIPLWRQTGPSSKNDPLNNEFTMQETLSPALFMFALLLDPGWMPDEALKQRHPRSAEELKAAWFRLP